MNKVLISFFISLNVILVSAFAGTVTGTNFDIRGPDSITTTVGELTEIRIDIFNKLATQDSYTVQIIGIPSNIIEITNPSFTTSSVNSMQSSQISSNIRSLAEDPSSRVSITVTSVGASEQLTLNIPIQSKKFSLPEFGLIGFIQIIVIAGIVYFLFVAVKPKRKKRK